MRLARGRSWPALVGIGLAVWSLLLLAGAADRAGTGSVRSTLSAVELRKPFSRMALVLRPRVERSAPGSRIVADLEIAAGPEVSSFRLAAVGSGTVLASSAPSPLPGPVGGGSVAAEIPYTARGVGEGELRVTVEALDAAGARLATQRVSLYVLATASDVLHSASGPLEARLRRLEVERDRGRLSAAQLAAERAATLGAGARSRSGARPGSGPRLAAAGPQISGQVRWTHLGGTTHAVRGARVELRQPGAVDSSVLASAETDVEGRYALAAEPSADGSARDLFVRVLAQGRAASVRLDGATVHRIDSPLQTGVANDAALVVDLTANNADDNNTAFSVLDAVVTGIGYVEAVSGRPAGAAVVVFPAFNTFFDAGQLHIGRTERFDWDVILHEYGHFVQRQLGLTAGVGGFHSLRENLGERLGKKIGTELAWAEGWPTYFALEAQRSERAAELGIPHVGDTHYEDIEDTTIDLDAETQFGTASAGEDNEVSVLRILWDLADAADEKGDGVQLGGGALWRLLDAANPKSLSVAYQAITRGRPASELARIGCILTEHRVAPLPIEPPDGSSVPAGVGPTFSWSPNGGGPSHRNDVFQVEVYDASMKKILLKTREVAATSVTLTKGQASKLRRKAKGVIHWIVKGRQSDEPASGPYTSCPSSLRVEDARSGR